MNLDALRMESNNKETSSYTVASTVAPWGDSQRRRNAMSSKD